MPGDQISEPCEIRLRPATDDDCGFLFEWRNDPLLVSFSTTRKFVSRTEHDAWFERMISSPDYLSLIIETSDGLPAGALRFERCGPNHATVSVYLTREYTGRGWGPRALVDGCRRGFGRWPVEKIVAIIRNENPVSLSAFKKAGFMAAPATADTPPGHRRMTLLRSE